MLKWFTLVSLFVVSIILPVMPAEKVSADASQILISEVQTGGFDELLLEDGRLEFIELHNPTIVEADITGWKVQYFSATRLDVNDGSAVPTRELAVFEGSIDASGYILLSYHDYLSDADTYFGQDSSVSSGLLAKSGGHVRILNADGLVVDVIGWGTAKTPETKAVAEIPAASAAHRVYETESESLLDTNNNFLDFTISDTPSPLGGSLIEPEAAEEIPEPMPPTCDGVIISEILPNPAGIDTDSEFIELYNPASEPVFLEDCRLKTTASTAQYIFPAGTSLASGEYKAFYSSETKLVLANAAGGEVTLIGTNEDYSTQYAEDMVSDHSWALIHGSWQETALPTPHAPNAMPPIVAGGVDEEIETIEECPEGKFRNPETGRCKNLVVTAGLTPCAVGQVRSTETNRCRNITSLVASLVPCRTGQERSPETNRCRNVLAATTASTPCQDGYERNAETNRCRKSTVSNASPSVGSLTKDSSNNKLNYIFLIVTSVAVLGYGAYEYRRDISNVAVRIKAKRAAKIATK